MTAQTGEKLLCGGVEYWMATEPLDIYLSNKNIELVPCNTACGRGYYGTWEIRNSKLFLVGLIAYVKGYEEVGIDFPFPGQKEVFASWFSGEIRIPTGKLLKYVHMDYCSIYEKDNFLTFENGILKSKRIVYNTKDAGLSLLQPPGQVLDEGLGEPAESAADSLKRLSEENARTKKSFWKNIFRR
jgi:hypothetical protein